MADGIQIRITGDDSEFLKTLSSLESSALATLEGLTAAASAAGGAFGEAMARYGEAMGGADGPWDAEALIARAREMAGAVAQAWSGAAVLEAPMLTAARGALDPGALLTDALEGLQADFSGAAETLRAALMEGYLRPGFEGVDWEAMAQHLSARLTQAGQGGAAALAQTQPALSEAGQAAVSGLPAAMDVSTATASAGRDTAQGWISGFESRVGAMRAAARAAARSITAAFNGALGIASPSKVFRQSGRFSGEGFALGYEESIREAQRTVRGLAGSLADAAQLPARNAAPATAAVAAKPAGEDALAGLNIGLYVNDRKIAEATADANGRTANARARRLAAGWGHAT